MTERSEAEGVGGANRHEEGFELRPQMGVEPGAAPTHRLEPDDMATAAEAYGDRPRCPRCRRGLLVVSFGVCGPCWDDERSQPVRLPE
jgi:hypothetical protein